MNTEEKRNKAKELTGALLIDAYDLYSRKFNPINDESVENYNIIREEIIRRLTEKEK